MTREQQVHAVALRLCTVFPWWTEARIRHTAEQMVEGFAASVERDIAALPNTREAA